MRVAALAFGILAGLVASLILALGGLDVAADLGATDDRQSQAIRFGLFVIGSSVGSSGESRGSSDDAGAVSGSTTELAVETSATVTAGCSGPLLKFHTISTAAPASAA